MSHPPRRNQGRPPIISHPRFHSSWRLGSAGILPAVAGASRSRSVLVGAGDPPARASKARLLLRLELHLSNFSLNLLSSPVGCNFTPTNGFKITMHSAARYR